MDMRDVNTVWGQARGLLASIDETSSTLAKVWLDYLVPVSYDDTQIVFAVKLLQAKIWIEDRYLPYIIDAVAEASGAVREIVIVVDDSLGMSLTANTTGTAVTSGTGGMAGGVAADGPAGMPAGMAAPAAGTVTAGAQSAQTTQSGVTPAAVTPGGLGAATARDVRDNQAALIGQAQHLGASPVLSRDAAALGSNLSSFFSSEPMPQQSAGVEPHARMNFSNYVMGDSNEFAYKASRGVAESPGLYFNPLFIYGKSGLGKTHLLISIKNYINTRLPEKRVVYAPITEFINDFTNTMAGDRDLTSFHLKYQTCDVLLIDDVQNIEGKEGTTNALFELFNIFIDNRKQIVLSADRSPVEINIDERYTSRFSQGVTADIQPPNYEMKTAILKNYKRYCCNFLNIPEVNFSDEAVQKIVELSGSNIRELEGAVSNLIVYVSLKPSEEYLIPVTIDDVERVLGKSFFHKTSRPINFDMVIKEVESYFNVSRDELLSEKRSKNISHPRQVAMYLIRRYTDMSYPEIGDSFHKDHTTVIYADKNIQAKMVEEISVKVEVEKLAEILNN